MERIKLAIEKARAGVHDPDQATAAVPVLQEVLRGADVSARSSLTALKGKAQSPAVEPVAVQYRQTAVFELDESHLARERVVSHHKSHPASWAFDVLRTQVLQKMQENGWRTLAVTSPSVASGKTLVSVNLALSIAQQTDRTALLVDFDLRRPSVARTLGLNRPLSLNEVLDGRIDVSEALVNPGIERLVVLPTNRPVTHASEVLSSAKVGSLISDLRERYSDRIVIFDLPPVLFADDVMTVLPRIDCVLMVVGSGVSSKGEIEEAMNRLSKANVLGVVLNMDQAPAQNAYY